MDESEIVLRGLRPDDRPAIERILRAVEVFRPEEVAIGLELVDETLDPGPSTDYRWFLADSGGAVVGFACFGPVPLTEGTFDLYWIAVDPAAMGSGAARRLDAAVTAAVRESGGAGCWRRPPRPRGTSRRIASTGNPVMICSNASPTSIAPATTG